MQNIKFTTQTGKEIDIHLTDKLDVVVYVGDKFLTFVESAQIDAAGLIDCGKHHIGGKMLHIHIPAPVDQIDEIRAMCDAHDAHQKDAALMRRARYLSTSE